MHCGPQQFAKPSDKEVIENFLKDAPQSASPALRSKVCSENWNSTKAKPEVRRRLDLKMMKPNCRARRTTAHLQVFARQLHLLSAQGCHQNMKRQRRFVAVEEKSEVGRWECRANFKRPWCRRRESNP